MERIYKQIENAYGGFEQYFVINQSNSISISHIKNIFDIIMVHLQNTLNLL